MIEKTKTMVKEETNGKRFFPTKAFHDAQDHLQTNRVLVIKGNTGDGKTSTAIQLLHWLIEEQPSRQPLQLHDIKDLKLMTPNSNLVTFIDDIFGEKDVGRMDVQEWNKRITDLKTLFVNEQIHGNCLLITIRNEIFNALAKCSLGAVFTKANIIDLSLDKYKTKNEKQKLLEMYEPDKFSWEDDEKRKILACSPDIGFPQCCQLFCNSVELQKRRVDFFENPFQFFVEALSKLPECPAILFLFLNDGVIKVTDLDPNGDKVNKALLDEAFAINLVGFEDDRTTMTYKKKVGFVKDSLEKLSGYLVRKSKNIFCRDEVYRFDHHSIFVTVALLYGDKTRVGFIQNCPTDFLSYLTTSKTSSKSVAISSDHYTYLCERLLREFEREMWDYDDSCIDDLDVWKDREFVVTLIRLFDERKVDRLTVLSNACYSGSKECVVQLLREGVKPDKDTPLWLMIIRGDVYIEGDVDILKAVVTYLNEEIKLDLFNKACESGSVECALYLLHEGVKPDRDTPWWSLITGGHHGRGDVDVLKNVMIYLNDQIKLHLLNEACGSESEDCVSCLLCEGVTPTKETLFPVLE
ncbi:uncharacterized protein LOC117327154 [Pecten maximus]|uniref:uncharacterized protein LOC117327154 n=1 Tax=Pecten maximus TaxID=6579 RepID=UPI0014580D0D|nr:uncharacterized protein LOC117327154 [Pecten maximus]